MEFLDLIWKLLLFNILAFILICCGLFLYVRKKWSYFKNLGIPYYPVRLANMLRPKHITDGVRVIYDMNPEAKYVGCFMFTTPAILIRDLDLIKSIAIKDFDHFTDHKTFFDRTDPLLENNLTNLKGDKWREARHLLSPAFTSSKLKGMLELMVDCVKNLVDHLNDRPDSENDMVDTKELFTKYTNDVIATCAFGISVNSFENPENDFYVSGRKFMRIGWIAGMKLLVAQLAPRILEKFKINIVEDSIANFFKKIVKDTVDTRNSEGIRRPDMIQLMMDAQNEDSNKYLKLDITQMTAQALIFFLGGFEPSSTQMCFIAHELAINRDVQKKLQNEIDEVFKATRGNPTYEEISKMPYLDAVFNEALRLHSQFVILERMCTKTYELPPALPGGKSYIVEPGMSVMIPGSAIHRDSKYYDDPQKFRPDRYYEKKISINDVINLGFGIGPRSCIGNRFAKMETKILSFYLLSKFNLIANSKTCDPVVYDKSITSGFRPSGGFWLKIEPRSNF